MSEIRLTVRCAKDKDHAKVLRLRPETTLESAQHLARLLDGTSEFYVFPPGEGSPIGKCAVCGAKLMCEVGNG